MAILSVDARRQSLELHWKWKTQLGVEASSELPDEILCFDAPACRNQGGRREMRRTCFKGRGNHETLRMCDSLRPIPRRAGSRNGVL